MVKVKSLTIKFGDHDELTLNRNDNKEIGFIVSSGAKIQLKPQTNDYNFDSDEDLEEVINFIKSSRDNDGVAIIIKDHEAKTFKEYFINKRNLDSLVVDYEYEDSNNNEEPQEELKEDE